MKNINFFVTTVVILLSFSATAQINKATIEKHLPGTWEIVSEDDLKVLEEEEDMFLVRSITFMKNHRFGTDTSVHRGWNVEGEGQIIILDYKLFDGVVYEIERLNEKELVFNWGEKKIAYRKVE